MSKVKVNGTNMKSKIVLKQSSVKMQPSQGSSKDAKTKKNDGKIKSTIKMGGSNKIFKILKEKKQ